MAATCYLRGVSTRRMDKLVQSLGIGRVQRLGEIRCVLEAADLEPVPDPEAGVDGPDDRRVVGALEEPQVEDGFARVPGEQHPSRRGPRVFLGSSYWGVVVGWLVGLAAVLAAVLSVRRPVPVG